MVNNTHKGDNLFKRTLPTWEGKYIILINDRCNIMFLKQSFLLHQSHAVNEISI